MAVHGGAAYGYPDADAASPLAGASRNPQLCNGLAQGFRDLQSAWQGCSAAYDQELIAAKTADQIVVPYGILQGYGEFDQHLITGIMAVRIIDLHEAVGIQHHDRQWPAELDRIDSFGLEGAERMPPVRQTRQRIGQGDFLEPVIGFRRHAAGAFLYLRLQ